ncbi:MAG: GTPase ObgE [Firmicutes bacterium]|nr:GTPase ObgE [Bacillota bacterium]MDD7602000.1 GTPase ObgE [Bacillota bacterium]MDY5856016.1 GTPase ObgE [Anaerovoracaceae bacterium]
MFVDRARIYIKSGKGGDGAVTFRREPFVPEGGPDGGDGGRGGDVIFQADRNLRTLMDFRYKRKYEAENGQNGMKKKRFGKAGENLVIKVPMGTIVIDEATGRVMKDLTEDGESFVAAKGGRGGRGNVHFKNSVRQAPNFAEAGGAAKERTVILEMKLIADVGLVGFPNVGKSSLLSAATSAQPKIANYHFTTIDPNLGVVELYDTSFVMADIAGIIEGASEGLGLGFKFLKHIERTKVLIHVVDVSGSEGRNPIEDFDKINRELEAYSPRILKKPQLIAANKIDLIEEDDPGYLEFKEYVESKGYRVFPISAPLDLGVKELLTAALQELKRIEENPPEEEEEVEYFDFEADDIDPDYRKIYVGYDEEEDVFTLEGKQLEKIFNSTNFNDMGSLRYLYKYIEKNGAIDELKEMGLDEGDIIRIKNYDMEYWDEF